MRRLSTFLLVIGLLGAVATQAVAAQSPTTTEEMLSGTVTEEVEPGVLRVVSDGVRDITHSRGGAHFEDAVIVDAAGRVWRSLPRGHVYRLGTEQEASALGLVDLYQSTVAATPDGRLMTVAAEGLRVFDGESWSPDEYGIGGDFGSIAVHGGGTVWLASNRGLVRTNTGRVPEFFEWPDTYDGDIEGSSVVVTADGDVWLRGNERDDPNHVDAFLRFDGAGWEVVPAPDDASPAYGPGFDVGPEGTLWAVADSESPHRSLARYDDSGWTVFGEVDGVQPWGDVPLGYFSVDMVGVAPDGSAWVNANQPSDSGSAFEACDGLGRFDGQSWSSYLTGMCVIDYDFAPDGAVWIVVKDWLGDEPKTETYVITPEAVAAKTADPPSVAVSSPDITLIPTDDPAVFEVISEPHREWLHTEEGRSGPLAIARDDGVWVQGWGGEEGETLYVAELGVPGRTEFGRIGDAGAFWYGMDDLAFTADGTLWGASGQAGLRSFDGETWTRHSSRPWRIELPEDAFTFDFRGVVDLTEAPDGTLYGITEGMELAKVEDGEVIKRTLGSHASIPRAARAVAITPDGTIWVGGRSAWGVGIFADTETGWLLRLDGPSSESVAPLGVGVDPYVADLAVAPDGALWALLRTEDDSYLAHYDAAWTTYSTADGLPGVGARTFAGNGDRLAVDPDGRVWFSLFCDIPEELPQGDGLVVFDGESFEYYLEGVQVEDLAIASEGSVWTTTDQGVYVISPEAVAATE